MADQFLRRPLPSPPDAADALADKYTDLWLKHSALVEAAKLIPSLNVSLNNANVPDSVIVQLDIPLGVLRALAKASAQEDPA